MTHTTKAAWALLSLGLLAGCASQPSPLPRLHQARVILDEARMAHNPTAAPQIAEAEGALEYAEIEYQKTPNHPLSSVRADNALAKARRAWSFANGNRPPGNAAAHQ